MRKERQYQQLYGAYVAGEFSIGDQVKTPEGEEGEVIWSYRDRAGRHMYVIDDGSGFPVEIAANEVGPA